MAPDRRGTADMMINPVVEVRAPAKINLGLEILGKREDGYHEIRTILATIGLFDTIRIAPVENSMATTIHGMPGIARCDNLIQKAVNAFSQESGIACGYMIDVRKEIPSPGGIGGASSDGAATLMALNEAHGNPVPADRMHAIASRLGADVPFFLGSPVAVASGIGTDLSPLPQLSVYAVLVVPPLAMATKTASLYRALVRSDFSDGSRVERAAEVIRAGSAPPPGLLENAFTRAIYDAEPEVERLAQTLQDAGAPYVAMSGAGPGHYVFFDSVGEADTFAEKLRNITLPSGTMITVVPVGVEMPLPHWLDQ